MKPLLLAAALVLAAGPALAGRCPADMAEIDAALAQNPQLSEADLARVRALRAEGEQLHEAGSHAASVDVLGRAKTLLGLP
ncbi:hypothetical protein [Roseivivax sp. CAU 1761]